jgi:hypothetical protein
MKNKIVLTLLVIPMGVAFGWYENQPYAGQQSDLRTQSAAQPTGLAAPDRQADSYLQREETESTIQSAKARQYTGYNY